MLSVAAADLAKPDERHATRTPSSFYDANAARFGTPERRQLEQIVISERRRSAGRGRAP